MSAQTKTSKPDFTVTYDGGDLTDVLKAHLISLTVRDQAGTKSDQVSIRLDNKNGDLVVPDEGAWIDVALFYAGDAPTLIGRYRVDEVATEWPARTLEITGRAVNFVQEMKVAKTREWSDVTLADVVSTIAADHKMGAAVSASLADLNVAPPPYAQMDQINQSDFDLLTRLGIDFDATFKVDGERIMFIKTGTGQDATQGSVRRIVVTEDQILSARARATKRGKYEAVRTHYTDPETQEAVEVKIGSGERALLINRTYADAATAAAAARGKLDALRRGTAGLSLDLIGNPIVRAETLITIGIGDTLIDGEWSVKSAVHTLTQGGYRTQVEAEAPTV